MDATEREKDPNDQTSRPAHPAKPRLRPEQGDRSEPPAPRRDDRARRRIAPRRRSLVHATLRGVRSPLEPRVRRRRCDQWSATGRVTSPAGTEASPPSSIEFSANAPTPAVYAQSFDRSVLG